MVEILPSSICATMLRASSRMELKVSGNGLVALADRLDLLANHLVEGGGWFNTRAIRVTRSVSTSAIFDSSR